MIWNCTISLNVIYECFLFIYLLNYFIFFILLLHFWYCNLFNIYIDMMRKHCQLINVEEAMPFWSYFEALVT